MHLGIKNFFKRVKAKTPLKNKIIGIFFTIVSLISGLSAVLIESGYIHSDKLLVKLTIVSFISAKISLYHAQKTKKDDE